MIRMPSKYDALIPRKMEKENKKVTRALIIKGAVDEVNKIFDSLKEQFGKDTPIEIRTSALPAEFGESIVLRILNPKSLIRLDELGLRKDLFETLKKEIRR